MDPQQTKDGKPYGPLRYKEIVRECYYISTNIHTSYNEVLKISPSERELLMKYVTEDIEKKNKQIEQAMQNRSNKKK